MESSSSDFRPGKEAALRNRPVAEGQQLLSRRDLIRIAGIPRRARCSASILRRARSAERGFAAGEDGGVACPVGQEDVNRRSLLQHRAGR